MVLLSALLARQPRLWSHGASTARPRWAEVHGDGGRQLVAHLVAAASAVRLGLIRLLVPATHVSPAPDAGTVFDLGLAALHLRLPFEAKVEAAARVVAAASVALNLLLRGRPCVSHRCVALAWDVASDRRHVAHCCVSVGRLCPTCLVHILHRVAHLEVFCARGLLCWVAVRDGSNVVASALLLLVNLSQAAIERILAVLSHRFVDFTLVRLSRS